MANVLKMKRRSDAAGSSILVVEPYDAIRKLITVALEHDGHDVVAVSNGRAALAAMSRTMFDCLVVGSPVHVKQGEMKADPGDLMLLEHLEKHSETRLPCIVMITTYVESERVLSVAERLDVCAVFAKPFSPAKFVAILRDCLEGRPPIPRWQGIPAAPMPGAGSAG